VADETSGRRPGKGLIWTLVLIGLFATLFALGWIGYHLYDTGAEQSPLDELYKALQLFGLNFNENAGQSVPLSLQVSRFGAPLVTVSAFIGAFAAIFSEQVTHKRVEWVTRRHVVVCGLGRIGGLLAPRLRRAGYRVVAIEPDKDSRAVGECRAAGVTVLEGNASDRTLLARAIKRARHVFIVAGDDEVNLRIANDVRDIAASRTGHPLSCYVHLIDAELAELLFRTEIDAAAADRATSQEAPSPAAPGRVRCLLGCRPVGGCGVDLGPEQQLGELRVDQVQIGRAHV